MHGKLSLMRYFNTWMNWIYQTAGAFYKPLFFSFPNDEGAYEAQ